MVLSIVNSEDDVIAQIKTVPGIDVYAGAYTPDSFNPRVDAHGMFTPYVLVRFNGSYQTNDQGIIGYDKDTLRNTFTAYIVSPDDRTTRDLRDQVRQALLVDFQPTDSSSLAPAGGLSFVDADLGYNRYVNASDYYYITNLSVLP